MENKKKALPPFWIVFLFISLLFLWLGISSSKIYKSSMIEAVNTYVYEKNITNEVLVSKLPKKYILNYNVSTYTIMKDRDTTIVLKNVLENNGDFSKETKESLVYRCTTNEIIRKVETVCKNAKRAKQISNLSISHFILVGLPSYFASLIFFLIALFIFVVWKEDFMKKRWEKTYPKLWKLIGISCQLFYFLGKIWSTIISLNDKISHSSHSYGDF